MYNADATTVPDNHVDAVVVTVLLYSYTKCRFIDTASQQPVDK